MSGFVRGVLRSGKRKAGNLYRESIRPFMPRTSPVKYAGELTMHDWRLFDRFLPANFRPYVIQDLPGYELQLIKGLKSSVKPGHTVVVVGGGEGTTAVVAAKLAAPTGHVICFEAAAEQLPIVRGTADRNAVKIDIRYGAVGEAISVYGDKGGSAPVITPEELPECDVLEMDCEGAERIILSGLKIRPETIIVETHGVYGAPTALVKSQLEALGYIVLDFGWAEPRIKEDCEKYDVRVLVGRKTTHKVL